MASSDDPATVELVSALLPKAPEPYPRMQFGYLTGWRESDRVCPQEETLMMEFHHAHAVEIYTETCMDIYELHACPVKAAEFKDAWEHCYDIMYAAVKYYLYHHQGLVNPTGMQVHRQLSSSVAKSIVGRPRVFGRLYRPIPLRMKYDDHDASPRIREVRMVPRQVRRSPRHTAATKTTAVTVPELSVQTKVRRSNRTRKPPKKFT